MAAVMDPVSKMGEQRETGWVSRLFSKEASTPEYQELKFTLHRKLLDRINLEALSSMSGERVRTIGNRIETVIRIGSAHVFGLRAVNAVPENPTTGGAVGVHEFAAIPTFTTSADAGDQDP